MVETRKCSFKRLKKPLKGKIIKYTKVDKVELAVLGKDSLGSLAPETVQRLREKLVLG